MELVVEAEKYKLFWVDDAKTVMQLDIERGWIRDDAHIALSTVDEQLALVQHEVYSLYYFKPNASSLPPRFAVSNIRSLLKTVVPNEKMVIFVGAQSLLVSFIRMLTKVYNNLVQNVSKIHFVDSLDVAFGLIEDSKRKVAQNLMEDA